MLTNLLSKVNLGNATASFSRPSRSPQSLVASYKPAFTVALMGMPDLLDGDGFSVCFPRPLHMLFTVYLCTMLQSSTVSSHCPLLPLLSSACQTRRALLEPTGFSQSGYASNLAMEMRNNN